MQTVSLSDSDESEHQQQQQPVGLVSSRSDSSITSATSKSGKKRSRSGSLSRTLKKLTSPRRGRSSSRSGEEDDDADDASETDDLLRGSHKSSSKRSKSKSRGRSRSRKRDKALSRTDKDIAQLMDKYYESRDELPPAMQKCMKRFETLNREQLAVQYRQTMALQDEIVQLKKDLLVQRTSSLFYQSRDGPERARAMMAPFDAAYDHRDKPDATSIDMDTLEPLPPMEDQAGCCTLL